VRSAYYETWPDSAHDARRRGYEGAFARPGSSRTRRCSTSCAWTTTSSENVNVHALDVNSDAIAASVLTFAYDSASVNAVAGKPGNSEGLYKSEKLDPMTDAFAG
jgi:hypothetical protein